MKKTFTPTCALIFSLLFAASGALSDPGDIAANFDSNIRLKLVVYPQKPGDSDVPSILIEDASRTIEVKYDWGTWFEIGENIRLDTAGWIEYGMPNPHRWAGGFELFQDEEIFSRPVVLNELYVTAPIGNWDLVLGRAVQRNTVSVLYPLADRYIARDFNDPMDPKILGVWQARADYYRSDWQYSLAALPVFQPPKTPGIESRWWIRRVEPVIGEPIPPGATGRIERSVPGVTFENTGVLATIRTRRQGWDFFTSAYHGYSPYPVMRTDSPAPGDFVVTVEYVPGFDYSAGISTVIDTLELHSEALYHHTYSGDDDDYINGLVGCIWRPETWAEWLHCNQVHLSVEYAAEHVVSRQKVSSGYATSSKPFRLGRNTLFTEFLLEVTAKDLVSAAYSHNFTDGNAFVQLRGEHRFGNGIRMELVGEVFAGDGLYYGTWNNNDRIYLNLEYSF